MARPLFSGWLRKVGGSLSLVYYFLEGRKEENHPPLLESSWVCPGGAGIQYKVVSSLSISQIITK
jgi:hypothetical protein